MSVVEIPIPILGVSYGFPVGEKSPPATSGYMLNCRPIDVLEGRIRLGQRPALEKWGAGTLVGAAEQPVVAFAVVSTAG